MKLGVGSRVGFSTPYKGRIMEISTLNTIKIKNHFLNDIQTVEDEEL